jgi:hypothetical protein
MSHHHHAPALPYCRNCHYTLAAPRPVYCGHCGQETDLHPPSVREMFTEYLGHYVAFDGPLWRTLWALVAMPGQLTNAYFHGARRRYVLPLRVYLSASFVFFVGFALLPQGPTQVIETAPAPNAQAGGPATVHVRPGMTPAEAAREAEALSRGASSAANSVSFNTTIFDCDLAHQQDCSATQRFFAHAYEKGANMTGEQWLARVRAMAPYAMLIMQPLFAALLLALFAGSGRRYAEHFVFSLHSHSLWFLALLLAMAAHLEGLMLPVVFGHGVLALRRVYGLGWWGAIWRGVLLSVLYFVPLVVVAMLLITGIAATAH